jgi:hypothetical protein
MEAADLPPPEPHPLAKGFSIMPASVTADSILQARATCEARGIEGTFLDLETVPTESPLTAHINFARVRRLFAIQEIDMNAEDPPPTDPVAYARWKECGNPHSGSVFFALYEDVDGIFWYKKIYELDCCISENRSELSADYSPADSRVLWRGLDEGEKYCAYHLLYEVQEFQKEFETLDSLSDCEGNKLY